MWIIIGLVYYTLGRFLFGGGDILNLTKVILFLAVSYYIGETLT